MNYLKYFWSHQWRRGFFKGLTYWRGWKTIYYWVVILIRTYIKSGMIPNEMDRYYYHVEKKCIRLNKLIKIKDGFNK